MLKKFITFNVMLWMLIATNNCTDQSSQNQKSFIKSSYNPQITSSEDEAEKIELLKTQGFVQYTISPNNLGYRPETAQLVDGKIISNPNVKGHVIFGPAYTHFLTNNIVVNIEMDRIKNGNVDNNWKWTDFLSIEVYNETKNLGLIYPKGKFS